MWIINYDDDDDDDDLQIIFTFRFDHFDWFSQLYSEWRQAAKLVNLKISAKIQACNFAQNLNMTKTS